MTPLAPMLASPMIDKVIGEAFDTRYRHGWALERKLDGHRITADINGTVTAWSRPSRSKPALVRQLPPPMVAALKTMGRCDVDGELVAASGKSWDVVTKGVPLVYVIFDIRATHDLSLLHEPYDRRREILLDAHLRKLPADQQSVTTVVSIQPPTWEAVQAIWADGGEGAILKRVTSRYEPGARSAEWVKVKPELQAVLTIVGYEAGKSGPYSAIRLRDADGQETTVKTLGHALLRDFTTAPDAFLGRQVVITYQERTPAGGYRHGRFDHFKERA